MTHTTIVWPKDVPEDAEAIWLGERFVIFHVPELPQPWRAYERLTGNLVANCIEGPVKDGQPSGRKYVYDYVTNREIYDW